MYLFKNNHHPPPFKIYFTLHINKQTNFKGKSMIVLFNCTGLPTEDETVNTI